MLYLRLLTGTLKPIDTFETYEKNRGREEWRRYELFPNDPKETPNDWVGIERVVKVTRQGIRKGTFYFEESFFILSKPLNSAQIVGQGIRQHWFIENNSHWNRDVFFKEDNMWVKKANPAAIIAFLNTSALALLKLSAIPSIKDAISFFTNKVNELNGLFRLEWE